MRGDMNAKNVNYSDSTAYVASVIAKASSGTVFSIKGYNSHSSAVWIQLHDSATLPSDAAVPKLILHVAATSNFEYDLGEIGRFCEKGIVVCNSSTGPTKTIGGATAWFNIQYV